MCSVCDSSAVKGRGATWLAQSEALRSRWLSMAIDAELRSAPATKGPLEPGSPEGVTRRLTEIVWRYIFMHYFWMKQDRQNKATEASSPHQ